jgi:hypothetical protein
MHICIKNKLTLLAYLFRYMESRNTPIERPPMLGFKQSKLNLALKVCRFLVYVAKYMITNVLFAYRVVTLHLIIILRYSVFGFSENSHMFTEKSHFLGTTFQEFVSAAGEFVPLYIRLTVQFKQTA